MSKGFLQWLVPTGIMLIAYSIGLYSNMNMFLGVLFIAVAYIVPYFLITKYYEEKPKETGKN